MSDDDQFIQALALSFDPAWRRQPAETRLADVAALAEAEACAPADGVTSYSYSLVGLRPGADLLLWRLGPSLDALEGAAARLLRAGAGRWASVSHSFIGRISPSQYVAKPTSQEQSLFAGERSRYLVVYPFVKTTEWYLLGREARQGIMNEHMRIGHDYPTIRQLLAYSFGLDDQDFVVAYETDDLVAFGDLVRALRGSDSRRSTVRDTPVLVGLHRPIETVLTDLGG